MQPPWQVTPMHNCPNCRQPVEDNILYCPTCGTLQFPQAAPARQDLRPQEHQTQGGEGQPYSDIQAIRSKKNPWLAGILNFFLPGLGYVYNGIGRDKTQIVFGGLIFLSVFLGIFVPIFGAPATTTTGSSPPVISVIDLLSVLILLLPFALAYDAYARTNRMNKGTS